MGGLHCCMSPENETPDEKKFKIEQREVASQTCDLSNTYFQNYGKQATPTKSIPIVNLYAESLQDEVDKFTEQMSHFDESDMENVNPNSARETVSISNRRKGESLFGKYNTDSKRMSLSRLLTNDRKTLQPKAQTYLLEEDQSPDFEAFNVEAIPEEGESVPYINKIDMQTLLMNENEHEAMPAPKKAYTFDSNNDAKFSTAHSRNNSFVSQPISTANPKAMASNSEF